MLFYLKKHALLEIAVALLLCGLGYWGIVHFELTPVVRFDLRAIVSALVGAAAITTWTLLVQFGYARVRGPAFADQLTRSLACDFEGASLLQVVGGLAVAASEEVFFRGFIHGHWGLWAGAIAFMLAHIGKKDIRVIGYWSIFQGIGLGLLYEWSGNLVVPILAHALFDAGAMIYFRRFMAAHQN